ncbi:large ATP-binding protein [Streptomyces sp. NPDC005722]
MSYLHGRDEAWVARFLDDLDRRLGSSPVRFVRTPADGARGPGSPGVATADRVLVLCSPAYFSEGPADADWAMLAHRTSLDRARGAPESGIVLPLLWEPVPQRMPAVVAEADTFTAGQPPQYRTHGLALMTMQAARHRAALDEVLGNLTRWLTTDAPGGSGPAPEDIPAELPPALASDDARFTGLYRGLLTGTTSGANGGHPLGRRLSWQDGPSRRHTPSGEPAAAGRRLLLIGPAGSGRSAVLGHLADRVAAGPGGAPWGCQVAFTLRADAGGLPSPDGIVQAAAPSLAAREPAGWSARQLRAGRALLAVHGLDRAPVHMRPAAWEWLLRTAERYPDAVILVEANGSSVPWHRIDGVFTPVLLEPLDRAEREALLAGGDPLAVTPGGGPALASVADDPLLADAVRWPSAAVAVRHAARAAGERGPDRMDLLRAAVAAVWRPDREAAHTRTRVRDSVLRAAAGGLAAATLGAGDAPLPAGTALDALYGLGTPGLTGTVPPDRLLSQLADEAGILFSPAPATIAFAGDSVRQYLAAEHLAAHPGPAGDAVLAGHVERTGSSGLARLVAELSAARKSLPEVPGLLEHGATGRRLTAGAAPGRPPAGPLLVRSAGELAGLAERGETAPEVWCRGPLGDLGAALAGIPGLRSLVISDHPEMTAVPDLSGCASLRSLRLADCPRLHDLSSLGGSPVMFLTIAPWHPSLDLRPLRDAAWLRRIDLVTAGAPGGAETVRAPRVGRADVRVHAPPGPPEGLPGL